LVIDSLELTKKEKQMSELAQVAKAMRGNFGLHVEKYPSGKFGFIGSVPMVLAYRMADGSAISDKDAADIRSFGPGLVCKSRGIRPRVWNSREEAITEAQSLGYEVAQ
jgi:hypothetical protein